MEMILKGIGLLLALYIAWEILRLFIWDIFEGRISRSTFILINLFSFLPILIIVLKPELMDSELIQEISMIVLGLYLSHSMVLNILLLFMSLNITAKRFRDAGESGWILVLVWTFIVAILPENIGSVISLLIMLYLFIAPSSKEENYAL
jgi:uncharacterized membrane protein YhaH (DUF805 family)